MSTITPLGDAHFFNVGFTSPNNFGVDIDYVSDIWGGDSPNLIPNPPLILEWPEGWGQSGYVEIPVYRPPPDYVPDPVPEPGHALIVAVVLVVMALRRSR